MTATSRPRPVFIAAMLREIESLVSGQNGQGWRADEKLRSRNIHVFEHEDAIAACAGMGAHRASLAIEAALSLGPASELVSVGWAGACNPRLKVGDVIYPGVVVDVQTGERFFINEPNSKADGIVATVASPAGAAEKERLSFSYHASAVDMEAAAVARVAQARELSFAAIKAISDASDFELPDLARFSTSDGQFREVAFGLHAALRPSLWRPMLTMAKGSKLAAARLCTEIEAHLRQHRDRIP